ncbi:MAG: triose-phosphate isomerase [Armatimonadota bacterium]|nr:triose-phosphate isomerase [Armatimonadota bacterium]
MNGEGDTVSVLARELRTQLSGIRGADIAICPPFTALQSVAQELAGSGIHIGAQDMFWKDSGAYTGKVSGPMLKAAGCTHVILGHSECRGRFGKQDEDITDETIRHFGDTNATVALKLRAALRHELGVIVCVGETLAERDAGSCDAIVDVQVHAALHGLQREDMKTVTVAYEPVWAIGTGQTCDAAEANRVCGVIRHVIGRIFGDETAQATRIQYGGSVTAHNAQELLSQPEIDGALVGGQSLKADAFARIVQAAL